MLQLRERGNPYQVILRNHLHRGLQSVVVHHFVSEGRCKVLLDYATQLVHHIVTQWLLASHKRKAAGQVLHHHASCALDHIVLLKPAPHTAVGA